MSLKMTHKRMERIKRASIGEICREHDVVIHTLFTEKQHTAWWQ
jgi:hypothetical protein